ncbi:ATP-binding protein [Candidatus Woesearchaeota archaeon]|nr:ATP-binding protein [Candidatus Woesearchaeota archaeon]
MKGQIISGEFGKICVRQKSSEEIELGELMIADTPKGKVLLQVYDLVFGSQMSQQNLELVSGIMLEQETDLELFDPELRNYNLAFLKPLISVDGRDAKLCKVLPRFFSDVREVQKEDLEFLTKPKNPFFVGNLRSGSKMLDVEIFLAGEDVLSHHILVPATTGRGKSNLTSVVLWNLVDEDYCGVLVLDPHDEYYGRNGLGLKDKSKEKVVYYSTNPPAGCRTLKINLKKIRPSHFSGVVEWSDPQQQCLNSFYREYGERWIEAIVMQKPLSVQYVEGTLAVVRRRLLSILDLEWQNNQLFSKGVFDLKAGETTINEIIDELEQSRTVIIDTSAFSGAPEILIGSLVASDVFMRYRDYKKKGALRNKPVISVVLEEAPRVLGKEVLEKGSNVFSAIAREGRKFKIGLYAITQLPSLIPRQILANMNTKIILGIEMQPERQAIIESASQDLSTDSRNIASLDKGEAIITSNFSKFAIPVKIPLFRDIGESVEREKTVQDYAGIKL